VLALPRADRAARRGAGRARQGNFQPGVRYRLSIMYWCRMPGLVPGILPMWT